MVVVGGGGGGYKPNKKKNGSKQAENRSYSISVRKRLRKTLLKNKHRIIGQQKPPKRKRGLHQTFTEIPKNNASHKKLLAHSKLVRVTCSRNLFLRLRKFNMFSVRALYSRVTPVFVYCLNIFTARPNLKLQLLTVTGT